MILTILGLTLGLIAIVMYVVYIAGIIHYEPLRAALGLTGLMAGAAVLISLDGDRGIDLLVVGRIGVMLGFHFLVTYMILRGVARIRSNSRRRHEQSSSNRNPQSFEGKGPHL